MKMKPTIHSIVAAAATLAAQSALAIVTGAFWTTDSTGTVDRNIYADKCEVHLSGGPGNGQNNNLLDGTYYWQITDPDGDPVLNRSPSASRAIQVVNGQVVPLRAIPACDPDSYDDSTNGEYKAWLIRSGTEDCVVTVSEVSNAIIVRNSQNHDSINSCSKTDNFRIDKERPPPPPVCDPENPPPCGCNNDQCSTPSPPTIEVSKTAQGFYDEKWPWSIAKTACAVNGTGCQTKFNQVGGTVSFSYTLSLTVGPAIPKNYEVTGQIAILTMDGTTGGATPQPVVATGISATDQIAYGPDLVNDTAATCVLGTVASTYSGEQVIEYTCTYDPDAPADRIGGVNQVIATSSNAVNRTTNTNQAEAVAAFTFTKADNLDACVTVTDTFNNGVAETKGQVCLDTESKSFTYTRPITPPSFGCIEVPNLARFTASGATTEDPSLPQTGTASQTVTVCGPVKTGGLTIGYWQNKNGQDIIKRQCGGAAGTSLYAFLTGYMPFKDLTQTTCDKIATYVSNVIKAANASGASMNAMLKAQMLATALNVYFSDTALGGNAIGAPGALGGQGIDLTKICKNIAVCSIYEDTTGAFGGTSPQTVSQLLGYAASQCTVNGCATSGWYVVGSAQSKAVQELAKDTFDAINNQKAFAP